MKGEKDLKRLTERFSGNEKEQQTPPVYFLLFLIAGIYGILLLLWEIPGISFSRILVFAAVSVFCLLLWTAFFYLSKWFFLFAAATAAVWLAAFLTGGDQIADGFVRLAEVLSGAEQNGTEDITGTVVLILELTALGMIAMEFVIPSHWILYVLLSLLFLGGPALGILPGTGAAILCLLFQILFWTIHAVSSDGIRRRKKRRKERTVKYVALMSTFLAVIIPVSCLIVSLWGTELSGAVYRGEGFFYRSLQRISGSMPETAASGIVSRGNNYRTGEGQIEVTVSERPEETLYLKGFTGGEYSEGSWDMAEEEEIFHDMAVALDWEEWESWISAINQYLYFSMNHASSGQEPRVLDIRHLSGGYDVIYVPYYSSFFNEQTQGYEFRYYEQDEMDIRWDRVPVGFEQQREWYREVRAAYLNEIQEAYTGVPEEELPRLTELCAGREGAELNETTAFIIATLQSRAEYTLTPGRAPLNEDIVEYFLFDNRQGYCVHFASAATLMYRLCGVPARYASGYAVQPSAFELGEDGLWRAVVTDESAHAWTEIYLEDYGWTPVEVTPASDGTYVTSYPGLDGGMLSELLRVETGLPDRPESENSVSEEAGEDASGGEKKAKGRPEKNEMYRDICPFSGYDAFRRIYEGIRRDRKDIRSGTG